MEPWTDLVEADHTVPVAVNVGVCACNGNNTGETWIWQSQNSMDLVTGRLEGHEGLDGVHQNGPRGRIKRPE